MSNKFKAWMNTVRRLTNNYAYDAMGVPVFLLDYWQNAGNPYKPVIPPDFPVQNPIISNATYNDMIADAVSFIGLPYSNTRPITNPPTYFDCSSYVAYLYDKFNLWDGEGTTVTAYTGTIYTYLSEHATLITSDINSTNDVIAGDLAMWNGSNGSTYEYNAHVAICLGNQEGLCYTIEATTGGVNYHYLTWHTTALSRFVGVYRLPTNVAGWTPEVNTNV